MAATVGVVGLGNLGLPVAVTLALCGHKVVATDKRPARMTLTALSPYERAPGNEASLASVLDESLSLRFAGLDEVLAETDCVFVIVDTAHLPAYDGTVPLPDSRADFSYDALISALTEIARRAAHTTEIGVMSTVLPGTMCATVLPLTTGHQAVYCPQFVSMGTVAHDLCHPEFVLLGCNGSPPPVISSVLCGLSDAAVFPVSYETAELAKMVYNTYVSTKVTIANVVQRMAHEVGADAADVFRIIGAADRRLLSRAYIGPGMGDGGPCHPRDNIALSWLARRMGHGADLFTAVMRSRQAFVEWLGQRFVELAGALPLVLLGTAFKPGTDIEKGSSAVLMVNLLRMAGVPLSVVTDPTALRPDSVPAGPAAYFLGCPVPEFIDYPFPPGSVVVDPWHRVPARDDVTVHWIGSATGNAADT